LKADKDDKPEHQRVHPAGDRARIPERRSTWSRRQRRAPRRLRLRGSGDTRQFDATVSVSLSSGVTKGEGRGDSRRGAQQARGAKQSHQKSKETKDGLMTEPKVDCHDKRLFFLVANLFRRLVIAHHNIFFQAPCTHPPFGVPKQFSAPLITPIFLFLFFGGIHSLILPLGAKNPNYATGFITL